MTYALTYTVDGYPPVVLSGLACAADVVECIGYARTFGTIVALSVSTYGIVEGD